MNRNSTVDCDFMRQFVFFISMFFFSCRNQIHVSGIVADKADRTPLENVLVRTIRDGNASELNFVETKTKNGRFTLTFSSQQISGNEITVELSKDGYLTNTYSCFQDKPNDTLFLVRQY